jgi:hypothetical protein
LKEDRKPQVFLPLDYFFFNNFHQFNMQFKSVEELKEQGFQGFKKMGDLFFDSSMIPKSKGVYMILKLDGNPEFLSVGTGGFFKGKNPNISIAELKANWVQDTIVIYIGKAGKEGSNANLQSRLKQYFGFGQGRDIGHYGGRLIWQLKKSEDLVVCWKALPRDDPREVEANLIREFISKYSARPFANLKD